MLGTMSEHEAALARLDASLASGAITRSQYDLRKAQIIADAVRPDANRSGAGRWVVVALIAVAIILLVNVLLGA